MARIVQSFPADSTQLSSNRVMTGLFLHLIAASFAVGCGQQPSNEMPTAAPDIEEVSNVAGDDANVSAIGRRYFIRDAAYDLIGGRVVVTDRHRPRVVTLDPWLEVIFAAADGQRTVDQFVTELEAGYADGAPDGLAAQTARFVQSLENDGLIKMIDESMKLPYYLSNPKSELDMDRATELMKKDGFIKPAE